MSSSHGRSGHGNKPFACLNEGRRPSALVAERASLHRRPQALE